MLQQILKYWYEIEFFNPCWPVDIREDTDLTKKDLPWQKPQGDPKIRLSHDVYLGKARSNDLIIWILNELNLCAEGSSIEKDNSLVCLCALKIDEKGKYVADSFVISSFVWAICKLIDAGSFDEKLDISELGMLQQNVNEWLKDKTGEDALPVSKGYLSEIYTLICKKIKLKDELFDAALWSRQKIQYANRDGEFPPLDPSTELLQSFYLKDIEKIRKSPTQRIKSYAQAMIKSSAETQRIQIDTDIVRMRQWLQADSFPLGVWPSPHSPSLMQQLGINIAAAGKQDIFSVNGPPGTGKTTLLKEIIVSNIIQRAILMAGYDEVEKAFTKAEIKNPPDQYNKNFYKLDKKLSAYGMIVASNNNAAVENISVELPKAIEKERTGRFSSAREADKDIYFSDVATKLLGEPAWGLISAKLGKKSHLKALRDRLWWANDGVTLKRYYEMDPPDWSITRQNFRAALQAVTDMRKDIAQAQAMLVEQEQAKARYLAAHSKNVEAQAELSRQQETLRTAQQELDSLENEMALQQQNIEILKSSLSFLKRILWWLFKHNPVIKEWKQTEQNVQETVIKITRQRTVCQTQKEVVQAAQTGHQLSEQDLTHAEKKNYIPLMQRLLPIKNVLAAIGRMQTFGKISVKISVLKRPVHGLTPSMTNCGKNYFIRRSCCTRRLYYPATV